MILLALRYIQVVTTMITTIIIILRWKWIGEMEYMEQKRFKMEKKELDGTENMMRMGYKFEVSE